jgi:oligopeptide/dipeptide ABC transporter ATP-binding protein
MSASPSILSVRNLRVSFPTRHGTVQAVRGVDLDVGRGEAVGLVGESGSGKSVSMLAVLGLLPKSTVVSGSIQFCGEELLGRRTSYLRRLRGARIAMVFQDPMTSLNPVLTIGKQVIEAIAAHQDISSTLARRRAVELLELVSIPDAKHRVGSYPLELSGGMRQRVMIAMAMANDPEVLIADEATTALDVTIQAQILEVLDRLRRERGVSIVLITHDLGIVAGMVDRVAVMYAGRIVEQAAVEALFQQPHHPYTVALLDCLPRLDRRIDIEPIPGSPPSPMELPPGCAFEPRCPYRLPRCAEETPLLRRFEHTEVACHRAEELVGSGTPSRRGIRTSGVTRPL